MKYLCYDVKGIQSFIFAVPRLKYIIGGSILIDQFDRETIPKLSTESAKQLFSGGGKGVFRCQDDATARKLEEQILKAAHAVGLSVALGQSSDYSDAARCADRFYPYLPAADELAGHPCQASGLYPVTIQPNGENVHPVIHKRVFQRGNLLRRRLEDRLLNELHIPQIKTQAQCSQVEFFHDISDDSDEGNCALASLGGRRRWAIVCMDGNDIGNQFRSFQATEPNETQMHQWIEAMSGALDACSLHAARRGCEAVLREWASHSNRVTRATTSDGVVVLPIRPLVVGGDDLVVLCHPQYAFDFVKEACRAFSDESERQAKLYPNLWPATDGRLTVSAGVLFCPIPLPLHMAIPYAESLLASAKGEGRRHAESGQPSPACIDYEVITESMLDTVADRRNRELRFKDGDTGDLIELTQKPYRIVEFEALQQDAEHLRRIPRSILHQLLPSLRAGESDRQVFRARLRKRHPELYQRLDETNWKVSSRDDSCPATLSTSILDQIEILEERHRFNQYEEMT